MAKIIIYFSARELLDDPHVWEPKEVDTKTAMDYENYGGQLLKTTGKVTRVTLNDDGTVSEFWCKVEHRNSR